MRDYYVTIYLSAYNVIMLTCNLIKIIMLHDVINKLHVNINKLHKTEIYVDIINSHLSHMERGRGWAENDTI